MCSSPSLSFSFFDVRPRLCALTRPRHVFFPLPLFFVCPQIDDALEYTDETLNALSLDTGVSGASILVAEDNPFNLEVVRTFIEMAHMKCTWAPNGQRVLDIYKENVSAFDLILMDCQMPIRDGYSATVCATRACGPCRNPRFTALPSHRFILRCGMCVVV